MMDTIHRVVLSFVGCYGRGWYVAGEMRGIIYRYVIWWYNMITTKRHRHTHGVLPLKAPPWIHNHHHQYVLSLLPIICTIFLHQQTSTSFTTRFFNSIHNSPPLLSPPLLFDPTLFSTDFNNKNHKTIHPPPTNILHPITSSHRPPPPPLPTTTLPSSGTHVHIPPTPLSTHTLYQFPRVYSKIFFYDLIQEYIIFELFFFNLIRE